MQFIERMLPRALRWFEESGPAQWEDLDLRKLQVDEAYVRVHNEEENPLWLYSLSEDCHKCPYSLVADVSGVGPHILTLSTKRSSTLRFYSNGDNDTIWKDDRTALCETSFRLGEFGVYDMFPNATTCTVDVAKEPANIFLPLVTVLVGLLALAVVHGAVAQIAACCGRRSRRRRQAAEDLRDMARTTSSPVSTYDVKNAANGRKISDAESPTPPSSPAPTPARRRVRSIDVFRGISIVLMIFVNDGAGGYWFLEHATWDGLHVADLVFPWFLWIMGVCIPLSTRPQLSRGISRFRLFFNVLRRSVILFALGVMVSSVRTSRLEELRIMGVLQRFGIVYFVVATLAIFFTPRKLRSPSKSSIFSGVHDILVLIPQWMVVLALTAGHVVLTFLLDIPGCPRGYQGPGGIHEDSIYKDCVGGAAGYVDRYLLGMEHLYPTPDANGVYQSGPFDPEGLMGCLTSVLQVFLGVQAGTILLSYSSWKGRTLRWLAWAVFLTISGLLIWYFGGLPVNKNLWSIPFVLFTSSMAFVLLTICYLLVDVSRCWAGSPFLYPGMNALVMYVGHMVVFCQFPFHWKLGSMNTHLMLLLESLWGTLLWIFIAIILYRRKVFISL